LKDETNIRGEDHIAIIGNCPDFVDAGQMTERCDWVTRFNNTAGFRDVSGTKISELVLVSRGGQATEWLADPEFADRPAVRQAEIITLVFPPSSDPADECCALELTSVLEGIGKRVRYIGQSVHDQARQELEALGAPPGAALSSGFVYAFETLLDRPKDAPPVIVAGFSFEGWDGHAWSAEKRWFEDMQRMGRLDIRAV
jgi:hypothetical protein